jgi:hypothetical protein
MNPRALPPDKKEQRRSKRFALQENAPEARLSVLGVSRGRTSIRDRAEEL